MSHSEPLSREHRELVERFRQGERRALARAISLVEDERPGFEALLDAVHGELGRARRVGVTGPPGSGKSTLVAALAKKWASEGDRVGVLAVDPTSPFTGGALLGDRIRMGDLPREAGIFIRSMASRGSMGGLATTTREAADLLDAFGFDRILLETVGVGQSELDVASSADTTAVVLVPESGDAVQTMKAGLMEIADLFVVNKADRPGGERLEKELRVMLRLRSGGVPGAGPGHHGPSGARTAVRRRSETEAPADGARAEGPEEGPEDEGWEPPVVQCVATRGEGVEELAGSVDRHWVHLERTGELEARRRERELDHARAVWIRRMTREAQAGFSRRRDEVEAMLGEGMSPYRVVEELARAPGRAE